LSARLEADPDVQVLDVRERREWETEHRSGSTCVPWHDLVDAPEGVARDRPVAVLCATGPRAATAAALLKRHGYSDVIHVTEGGVATLSRLGLPLEQGAPAPA
jgi:rhodanese-related sulfurtransferase